ncbi:MAG: Nif3-like dinuclear metal center hexameric protein, partial [Clostridia bacterium]|nr:Nif3-like dinuclear metal center hexameric protein [Clostridia bacterium]
LCTSGIAAFAAHTNLDAADGGVNDALAAAIGLTDVKVVFGGIGREGTLPEAMTPSAFAAMVAERLGGAVQLREGASLVKTVALVGGAGGDFVEDTAADAFLTGELKHHEWLALPEHLTVVSAGHYATENVVVEPLCARLREALPTLKVVAFTGRAPYETIG